MVERANRVIKQIFEQEKYDVILQEAIFAGPRVDITEKVIKALNAAPRRRRADGAATQAWMFEVRTGELVAQLGGELLGDAELRAARASRRSTAPAPTASASWPTRATRRSCRHRPPAA